MGTEDITNPGRRSPAPPDFRATAGKAAAAAGTVALSAVVAAAQNAARTGATTTEFKATVGAIVVSSLMAGLQVFSVVPGPWMLPATLLSVAIAGGSAAYTVSRGSVKKAALTAAAAVAAQAARAADPELPQEIPGA